MLSSILTGQGNLTLNANNGNINMQSLQDQYYYYSKHELTNLDIGALIAEILAAIIIGALTGGGGAALFGTAVAATAVTSAGIAALGIAMSMGIDAAIDNKNNGAGATSDMQNGYSDSTTKQYGAKVGNSLLFGGDVNLVRGVNGSANIDKATQIDASNINQNAQTSESVLFESKHETIDPNWTNLMINGVVTGFISGVTVVGSAEVLKIGESASGLRDIAMLSDLMDSINPNTVFSKPIGALVRLYDIDSVIKSAFSPFPLSPGVSTPVRSGLESALTLPHHSNNN